MKALRRTGVAIVFLTLGTGAIRLSGSPQTAGSKPSNAWQMRCVVKVTADTDVLPLSFDVVECLLRSDAVAGQAAQTTWPKGHGLPDVYFQVQPLEDLDGQGVYIGDVAASDVGSLPYAKTRAVLFGLRVSLNSDVGPVAREFGSALIGNLRAELQKAFTVYRDDLGRQLDEAEARRQAVHKEYEDMLRRNTFTTMKETRLEPADKAVYEQLDTIVDLSKLTPQMAAQEAFEILRNSVQPPLNLVVLWRDLTENTYIDPTSPIEMDGLANVRLGTALANLLSALADPLATGREYLIDSVVDNGVITVATLRGLPRKKMETCVYDLPPLLRADNQAPELAALIRETIEPESWYDLCGLGSGTIMPSPDGRLVVSQSRGVHARIQELLAKITADFSIALPGETSQESLTERMEALMPYREQLERELDRLQECQGDLARQKDDGEKQAMKGALRATMDDLFTVIDDLQQTRAATAKTMPAAAQQDKLRQALGRVAQCRNRCQEALSKVRSGSGWDEQFPQPDWTGARTMAERIAAKQRDLREVSRRISDVQRVLAGSKTFDMELSQVRWLARQYERAEARVHDLKSRLADLRPCTITVIGEIE